MKMNKIKKALAVALSFTMVFGMTLTSHAATYDSREQETSIMDMSSDNGTVSYKAVTTEGGERDGVTWPTVTVYSYYIELPSDGSKDNVSVFAEIGTGYTLKIDGETAALSDGAFDGVLDFTNGTKTFELIAADGSVFRSFKVSAGIQGQDLSPVYVRIDVKNAVDWLEGKTNVDATKNAVNAVKDSITAHGHTVNDDGQMADFVEVTGLHPGATAMDALEEACDALGLVTKGSAYYVAGIGTVVNNEEVYLSEKATEPYSGWLYLDKPEGGQAFSMANYGASSYNLNGGEQFVWAFANGWGEDQYKYLNQ